jgi:AraC-like DNA-binding protein
MPTSGTVAIALVNGFLKSANAAEILIDQYLNAANIPRGLLREPGARVTEEQFSTLYRLLAVELDDEMPGVFDRPLRSGTLKFLCLSLLDAPRLEVALHRFGQFFRIVLDDFVFESGSDGPIARVELRPKEPHKNISPIGQELMLKLAHGVASWLIGQRIPLLRVELACARPLHAIDHLYFFDGVAHFDRPRTTMSFGAVFLKMPIRQRKGNLKEFLARAPGDWIFESFAEQIFTHRVKSYFADHLPDVLTIEQAAEGLSCSVRTFSRRLSSEGTTYQSIKDELRRDVAISRLSHTHEPIASIANGVGFDDPSAFHRAFRLWTGSTPGTYRRRA